MIKKPAWAVFDPRGVVGAERLRAPRVPDFEGMRPGVLDDIKWNANRLLRKTAARLGAQVALPSSAMKP
jgi:hypothetical protein